MSIWCSWPHIGTDPTVMYEAGDGIHEVDLNGGTEGRTPVEQRAEGGNVLGYAEGFSNHHPDLTGTHERPAALALASIAPWCVPGHDQGGDNYSCSGCGEHHDYPEVGQWLRIEVAVPESLSFWEKDADGNPKVTAEGATVVLDRAAAETLRDQLNEWLTRATVEAIPAQPADNPGVRATDTDTRSER